MESWAWKLSSKSGWPIWDSVCIKTDSDGDVKIPLLKRVVMDADRLAVISQQYKVLLGVHGGRYEDYLKQLAF